MNIDILTNEEVNSLIKNNMYINFKHYFDSYLFAEYEISEEEFRLILKDYFAEKFV
jgi:hypothetical protein